MPYRSPHDHDRGDLLSGTRVCMGCDQRKAMAEFHWTIGRRYRRRRCKACCSARSQIIRTEKHEQYAEAARWRSIQRKYGITRADYKEMLARQNGHCGICDGELESETTHIDHDHRSGRVRGLLCFTCNTALGKFRDDPDVLLAAILYLLRSETRPEPTAPFARDEAIA